MRTFKTSWFNKVAKKALIRDSKLRKAVDQVLKGQAIDLGGGVFKKRLNENRHRSIILSKSGLFWIYKFLFAKKDLDNINDHELAKFRQLANIYAQLSE
jgi:hypothetical protein